MPLYKIINLTPTSQVFIWKISETFEDLFDAVFLKDASLLRVNNMKSLSHQLGFLSIRMLLQEAGYSDADLFYDETGKPNLLNGKHISITHSFLFSAIIISDRVAGIDIEMQREKIITIADKFMETEFNFLSQDNKQEFIEKSTVVWGVKESIFKIQNQVGISFKDHISVFPFDMADKKTSAILTFESYIKEFAIQFEIIENYVWVVAVEK